MEEQQIKNFVHRISTEETLRTALANNPEVVIEHEGFSPRVTQVLMRLVPHLTLKDTVKTSFTWWHQ